MYRFVHHREEEDVLMWENIGTLHNAVADYRENEHRLIKRCQVMADFVFSEEFRSTALDLHGSLPKSPPRLKKDTKEPRFIDEMPMTLPEQPECWGEGRPIQQKPGSALQAAELRHVDYNFWKRPFPPTACI